MANAFNKLGTIVNVVDMAGFLVNDDKDLTQILQQKLSQEGINFYMGYGVEKVSEEGLEKFVQIKKGKEIKAIKSDQILVAAGRKPNLDGLNLEKVGVQLVKGGVKTDKYLKTTAKNIWACGDIVPPFQFSHISEHEGVKASLNAFLPIKQAVNYDNIIWTIFTQPEISHLGLTETQAREKYGNKVKVSTYKYKDLDRSKTEIETFGMAKFIYLSSGKILGAHIVGKHSCEIINQVQTMKTLGISFYKAKNLIHSYPTYSDIIRQPAKKAFVKKILDNPIVKLLRK
ncbi:MAG: NAD(P)/FAD-dependent oxidoreductase [Elusimicrobiaceae bacterium]|nr:NAD(P)/FAD-dependent oxidoreductase [Elusimicrobiaceae bacterium]